MIAARLLSRLAALGVSLTADGDNLRIRAPRGVLSPELREEIRVHKDSLLESLRQAPTKRAPEGQPPTLGKASRAGELPLSFAQQRLWFLEQLEPGSPTYNIRTALRLDGPLEVPTLERSLTEIVRRHEALRTTFPTVLGEAHQKIAADPSFVMPLVDLGALPAGEREAEAHRRIAEESLRPFDLATGPLLRALLLRLSGREHVLVLTVHHIVSDGWSMTVLGRELGALHEAFSAGRPSPLPELPVQYADHAVWQRQWLSGDVLRTQLDYWKKQLAGAPQDLELPADRPRPPVLSYRGASVPVALPLDLLAGLRATSRREGVTLFMTLLAAFQVLLARYTGRDDIVVGSPIAGRTQVETEGLIGLFVNTLALRTDLSGDPTFRELLSRVREVTLGAYTHQDVPFERLVEELAPVRDLGRSPLFQAMLVLQTPPPPLALGEVKLGVLEIERTTSKFDLSLSLAETEDGLRGELEYSTDLFDEATLRRTVEHYRVLLEGIVADPGQRIADLPLSTAAELHRVVVEWNATRAEYPSHRCIHELFEAQAASTPEAVAVVFEDLRLTYRELNERANRLAHHLRGLGVGRDVPVALCVERSLEMVVGVLGIVKAGGAYVPLDPTYPVERLAFMLEDCGATVGLTLERLRGRLPPEPRIRFVALDAEWETIARAPAGDLVNEADPRSLAYITYTSGSTGRPKGVLVEHRGVVRLVKQSAYARFAADEVFLQLAPLAFDASTFEIWGALLSGGKLVVFPAERPSPEALEAILRAHGVTTLWLTSGLFNAILDVRPLALGGLRRLLVGGEALSVPHVQKALSLLDGVRLVNGYGPTEGTTFTCCFPITAPVDGPSIPIGRPIANTTVFVLDARRRPVPIGVAGELHIGGAGVARGYLNRPELTAERFLPDPFSDEPGARLYRTGDLCRYLPDGDLEYLGRMDHQVKVRGFRIELGEIESVLAEHPAIRAAAVLAREDVPGDKRLVAYLVAREAPLPGVRELRDHLKNKLPDYMVPAAFVALEALPLTPNGKVDRRALPAPEADGSGQEHDHVAPRTPVEDVLAGIWAAVLRVDRVSVMDNFFELGGHSLLATQVIGRLRSIFAVDVPLRALFEAPTVAGLATHIEAALRGGALVAAPPLRAVPREGDLPLSFAQQRLWFLDQLEPHSHVYNVPEAVRLSGPLDVGALEKSLGALVLRHESLRTTFPMTRGVARQHIAAPADGSLPVVDLQGLADRAAVEAEVRRRAAEEAGTPFDLATGPLFRTTLLRLSEQEHVLLSTVHHIVSDGWSTGVLLRELGALYGAFSAGRPSPLPDLSIQYVDHAVWQREWLSGDVLRAQLDYWKKQLAGAPPALELPTDRPRPAVQTYRGATVPIALSRELSAGLAALGRREGVTLFMTLLAAFQVLLARYTGQDDIVVGSPIAGRTHVETEGLIGFFVNTLVLRTDLSGEPTFRELLARVREVTLGAYTHQEVPFEKLVQELAPARDLSRSPLFQVMLLLQNAPREALSLGEVTLGIVDVERTTAKFDLSLSLSETGEGLRGTLEYSTDLFEAATAARMAGHLQVLLEGIVSDPPRPVSALPILTPDERETLLVRWNDTEGARLDDRTASELFEAQVEATPDATAVIFEDRHVTYRALDEQANRLARHLVALGAGPGSLIGLCVERSPAMVVGLLGILKSGAAYVPLDPSYPSERLAFMLQDAAVTLLVTEEALAGSLPEHGARIVAMDADAEAISACESANLPRRATPADPAYVIYTSGSTGRPKGVMVPHRALVNFLSSMARRPGLGQADTLVAVTTLSFDIAGLEVFLPLTTGAKLVIATADTAADGRELRALLESSGATALQATPATWRMLVEAGFQAQGDFKALCGGEALPPDLVAPLLHRTGRVWNMYGPTETTIWSTCAEITPDDPRVTIGRPIDATTVVVLDPRGEPVPVGVPGELHIGGRGVALGYLGRPDLTAERFVPDPFRGGDARMYRTGDLVSFRADGALVYHRRLDHQLKVRGYRIEPGEIESVLSEHPAVVQCAVIVREDRPGDPRLVAYVVPRGGRSITASDARRHLRAKLPEYMIPQHVVELAALPLSPAGKLARRELPPPAGAGPARKARRPETPSETWLAGIWSEVLGTEEIAASDNFFDLGGHSLLSMMVVARVEQERGLRVSPRDLLVQSLEQIAARMTLPA